MLQPDREVADEDLDRLNEPEMAARMLAAADHVFEYLMAMAEKVGKLPLARIPPEPILLNLVAAIAAQTAINLGGSGPTQRGMLDTIGKGASGLLESHITNTEGMAGPAH